MRQVLSRVHIALTEQLYCCVNAPSTAGVQLGALVCTSLHLQSITIKFHTNWRHARDGPAGERVGWGLDGWQPYYRDSSKGGGTPTQCPSAPNEISVVCNWTRGM